MKFKVTTLDAYNLLHEGSLVMTEMEANGIRVDVRYVKHIQQKIQKRIDYLTNRLKKDKIFKIWKKTYGEKTKIGSRSQLADVLFNKMQMKTERRTTTRYAADVDALEDLNLSFTKTYIECEKLKKAKNTYLANILRETVDGFIHPNFNLNTVSSFRGSSSQPNFTNIPVRDPLIKKLVRRSFIARKGHRIVDLDFKGSEVSGAAWYHKDPVMLEYINNPKKDMHRDMAQEIFMVSRKEITSDIRYCGKNMFVFPQFYGDWWLSCANALWRAINRLNLKTKSGIPLKKWLKKKGISELGSGDPKRIIANSFEHHLKEVEYDFWYNRFAVYQKWKEDWWEQYQERGWFRMLTGFKVSGYLNRKQVLNWPVQGTSFHGLLWSLIRMSKLIRKHRMPALLVGQIHDDAVADVPDNILNDYIGMSMDVITRQLPKHWPFIITPMVVETEVTPIGGSWYEKTLYQI